MQVQQDAPLYWLECANWRSYYTTNPLHKKKNILYHKSHSLDILDLSYKVTKK